MLKKITTALLFTLTIFALSVQNPTQSLAREEESSGVENTALSEFNETGVTQGSLRELNPLWTTSSSLRAPLSTPGGIISRVLLFAFPIAGIILFVMIVWGGFEMLSGAATKKSMDAGKQRVTAAIIGFVLLFVSFWIIQVVEVVFGIAIFG